MFASGGVGHIAAANKMRAGSCCDKEAGAGGAAQARSAAIDTLHQGFFSAFMAAARLISAAAPAPNHASNASTLGSGKRATVGVTTSNLFLQFPSVNALT